MPRKRVDHRPICTCRAYEFPHKIGGKCDGSAFAEHHWLMDKGCCDMCNCNTGNDCDVITGAESIQEAECYDEAKRLYPGEQLPM